jgi:predicted nuclease with TOPRIM domain
MLMRQRKTPVKEAKDGQVDKLKTQIRNLQKETRRLKSELKAYEQAFRKTKDFLKENTDEIDLMDLIAGAKENKPLKEIQDEYTQVCDKCQQGIRTITLLPFGKLYLCNNCGDRHIERKE